MDGFSLRRIDELPAISRGVVKLAGDDLGVRAFGLQVLDLPGGFADYPEHDHADDGQEEVYVVVRGSGRVKLDDDVHDIREWDVVRVDPTTMRNFEAGPDGLELIAFGTPNVGNRDVDMVPGWWTEAS